MFRKDDLMEGGPGILRSRLQSSAKWPDVSSFETELDTRILSSGQYMIQSNILSGQYMIQSKNMPVCVGGEIYRLCQAEDF